MPWIQHQSFMLHSILVLQIGHSSKLRFHETFLGFACISAQVHSNAIDKHTVFCIWHGTCNTYLARIEVFVHIFTSDFEFITVMSYQRHVIPNHQQPDCLFKSWLKLRNPHQPPPTPPKWLVMRSVCPCHGVIIGNAFWSLYSVNSARHYNVYMRQWTEYWLVQLMDRHYRCIFFSLIMSH